MTPTTQNPTPWSRRLALGAGVCALAATAAHSTAALACGGGAPVAPSGTAVDDLPYTQAFQIMITWWDDLDGAAQVSVGANIHNAPDGFGYVVPIPQAIDSDDLSVGSAELLDGMETVTGPRALRRRCDEFRATYEYVCPPPRSGGEGEGEGEGELGEASNGVAVETTRVGDYEVNLLTADGSSGLLSWLAEHDFELPPGSDEHIEEYLEQGYMFAAVSVPPGVVVADGTALPPLNFDLSEGFRSLPLLLAANAAQTTQDVVVTTYAPNLGAVGISNLREIEFEAHCMAREDDIGAAYGEAFAQAHSEADEAVWMLEFYQNNGEFEQYGEVSSIVYPPNAQYDAIGDLFGYVENLHKVGRLHVRYDPGQLTVDPAFYAHAAPDFTALEYYSFDVRLTEFLPVCGEGMVYEATCPETRLREDYCVDESHTESDGDKSGCSTVASAGAATGLLAPLLGLLLAGRRRD